MLVNVATSHLYGFPTPIYLEEEIIGKLLERHTNPISSSVKGSWNGSSCSQLFVGCRNRCARGRGQRSAYHGVSASAKSISFGTIGIVEVFRISLRKSGWAYAF